MADIEALYNTQKTVVGSGSSGRDIPLLLSHLSTTWDAGNPRFPVLSVQELHGKSCKLHLRGTELPQEILALANSRTEG